MSQSFYGGVAGRPFILKGKYATVLEMLRDFGYVVNMEENQNINSYNNSKIGFGEYVIIECKNRNNPEHGRIYRRTLDQTQDATSEDNKGTNAIEYWSYNSTTHLFESNWAYYNGAVYVGQINGPAGEAPILISLPAKIQAIDDDGSLIFENGEPVYIQDSETGEDKIFNSITELGEYYKENIAAFDVHYGQEEFLPDVSGTDEDGDYVLKPGKYYTGEGEDTQAFYNDGIKWEWCSIRDENRQSTITYVDITSVPYMVIEFDAQSVNPYFNRSDVWQANANGGMSSEAVSEKDNAQITSNFSNICLATRNNNEEDLKHPFYEKWNFKIPKGIHGMDIENIRIENANENIYSFELNKDEQVIYDSETHKLKLIAYEGRNEDIQKGYKVWVGTFIDYNRVPEGDKYTIYLGDYNALQDIELKQTFNSQNTNENNFIVKYTHNAPYEQRIVWPTNIQVNDEGSITTSFNNNTSTTAEHQMTWIKEATLETIQPSIDASGQEVQGDVRFKVIYNNTKNSPNIDLSLRCLTDVKIIEGGMWGHFNFAPDDVYEFIGTRDEMWVNFVAGQTEEDTDISNLRIGGMWLVTNKPLPTPSMVLTSSDEILYDVDENLLNTWEV